jgi:hypothetical protein
MSPVFKFVVTIVSVVSLSICFTGLVAHYTDEPTPNPFVEPARPIETKTIDRIGVETALAEHCFIQIIMYGQAVWIPIQAIDRIPPRIDGE